MNQQDIIEELQLFQRELDTYYGYQHRLADRKRLSENEEEHVIELCTNLELKVGHYSKLITELTGIIGATIKDKGYDIWQLALGDYVSSLQSLYECMHFTIRAVGQLQRDIKLGIRDKNTGELIVKVEKTKYQDTSNLRANWINIEKEFGVTKNAFGKAINFITDRFTRSIIFRDVEQAYILASSGFSKPAVVLAGSVVEELLRLYLEFKNISPISDNFDGYIRTCEDSGILKKGISRLSDSVRDFRNVVHLSKETTKRHSISKATAKMAVSSIFTIANDF